MTSGPDKESVNSAVGAKISRGTSISFPSGELTPTPVVNVGQWLDPEG